jgi:hypothetical protein
MSIRQLDVPCWVPSWAGDDRDDQLVSRGPHYAAASSIPTYSDGRGRASFHKRCGGVLIDYGELCWCAVPKCII